MNFFLDLLLLVTLKLHHTGKIGLLLTDRGRVIFPYIFPKAPLFSSQTESLQFPQLPQLSPLNTPENRPGLLDLKARSTDP